MYVELINLLEWGLNLRPQDWRAIALPTELSSPSIGVSLFKFPQVSGTEVKHNYLTTVITFYISNCLNLCFTFFEAFWGWTKINLLEQGFNMWSFCVAVLHQLSYLAPMLRSPYSVNIFVARRGEQSEATQHSTDGYPVSFPCDLKLPLSLKLADNISNCQIPIHLHFLCDQKCTRNHTCESLNSIDHWIQEKIVMKKGLFVFTKNSFLKNCSISK